jgi:hypothetical protein
MQVWELNLHIVELHVQIVEFGPASGRLKLHVTFHPALTISYWLQPINGK